MQQRRLTAIMFTDLVGFTSMMAKNEQETLMVLEKIRNTLRPLVAKYNGKWQKEIGDGTLSSFSSSVDAVYCALDFQRAIANENFKIRIGIHVGEVTLTENDIFGDGVNIAARIEPLALPGGICITDRVHEDIFNKPEIKTALLGERTLKNVNRPIKIFALVGDGLPNPPAQQTNNPVYRYLNDLVKRRVPQIVGLYLLSSFAIVQIVKWILDKYMLSPHWVDFTWILLLSLLPSIALISYYHGKSGMDKWVRTEKIFIPVNFMAASLILFFLFQGKDLGATTREIMVEDEKGNTIQRTIPKNEFIKNLAIFDFENKTGDKNLAWLSYGINEAILADLEQDLIFRIKNSFWFQGDLTKAEINRQDPVPFELKRSIARKHRLDYILSGSYNNGVNGYLISTQLHHAKNGKLIAEHTLEGINLFDLIDAISENTKADLQLSSAHIESVEDLPISNIFTSNMDAFKDFIRAAEVANFENDLDGSIELFLSALDKKPDFIQAKFNLAIVYYENNMHDEAVALIEGIMDKIYMFPLREQFFVKYMYYWINWDLEKQEDVLKMWIEIYPNDMEAYDYLANSYNAAGKFSQEEAILKSALKIDDNNGETYVSLANVLNQQGKKDEALSYYQVYTKQYPNHSRSFQLLGDFYFDDGNFDQAQKNYEKSVLLSRDNTTSIIRLIEIKERQGLFEEAEQDYYLALGNAKTSEDSVRIYLKLEDFYTNRGQMQKIIDLSEQRFIVQQRFNIPLQISVNRVYSLYPYFNINQFDTALRIIKREEETLQGPFKNFVSFGYIAYYINQGNIPFAEIELEKLKELTKSFGSFSGIPKFHEGEIAYLKTNYDEALQLFLESEALNTNFPESKINIKIAMTYWKMGDLQSAKKTLDEILRRNPFQATAHLLMAKIQIDEENTNKAKEHLNIANKVWENADEDYKTANEAKKLLGELEV